MEEARDESTRRDQVEHQGGIVHLPAEFREVARLANRAGIDGFEFVDAFVGIDVDAAQVAREPIRSFITITYRRNEAAGLHDLIKLTAEALHQRAAYISDYAETIGVRWESEPGRWHDVRRAIEAERQGEMFA